MSIIIFEAINNFFHDRLSTISSGFTFLTSIFLLNVNSAASELLIVLGLCSACAGVVFNILKSYHEYENIRRDREENKQKEQREQEEMKEMQDKKSKQ